MVNYSDFDLDLQNTVVQPQAAKVIKKITTLYTILSCPTAPIVECIGEISKEHSCGCVGASVTDSQCGCPPKDVGTREVCINSINNK